MKKFKKTAIISFLIMAFGLSLVFIYKDDSIFSSSAEAASSAARQLLSTYEPSAVQQLDNGKVVVLEDEVSRALNLLTLDSDGSLVENSIRDQELNSQLRQDFDDLEGIALGRSGEVYATTSFSRTSKGKQRKNREKLLRLSFDENDELVEQQVYAGFVEALKESKLFKIINKKNDGKSIKLKDINIEGLSFDATKQQLLFGFKKPLVSELSIIIRLDNPKQVLDGDAEPEFSDDVSLLDLNGGGIRSLSYDSELKGFLIANEVDFGGGPKQSQLWFWSGDEQSQAVALVLPEIAGMENIEAITAIKFGTESKVLVMSDDGSRRNKQPAHYQLIEYADIKAQIE
jgi:hypothetical protein